MSTIIQLYKDKIDRDELHPDKHQEAAAWELQRLYDDLTPSPLWGKGTVSKLVFTLTQILFLKGEGLRGVYLWGGVGRGKSMLMDMFFEELPETISKRRVHFHEFMIEVHGYMHKARQEKNADDVILGFAKKISKETRVLCFDEFHVTDITDAMILGRLFTALFKRGVVVVATSNWPPDNLYEGGLQRDLFLPFIGLLKERLEIIELNGDIDYRLQCLSDGGVYFTPLGLEAQRNADEVFAQLTDKMPPYAESLSVKGRTIEVEIVAKGVARFSFAQLCERPMGAEDYLTIAKNYHTIFLEGVPRLKYDRRNEAKRLMLLVDALYEQKTKLVITADALPDELYLGDDHGFEFQRTVSRLVEMQGEEYLGGLNFFVARVYTWQ